MDCEDDNTVVELETTRINLLHWKSLVDSDGRQIDLKFQGGFISGSNDTGLFICRYQGSEQPFVGIEGYLYELDGLNFKVQNVEVDFANVCLITFPEADTEQASQPEETPSEEPETKEEKPEEPKPSPRPTTSLPLALDGFRLQRGDQVLIGEINSLYASEFSSDRIKLVEFSDFYDCTDEDFISKYKDDYRNRTFIVLIRGGKAVKVKPF
jgi:hypothetical protein